MTQTPPPRTVPITRQSIKQGTEALIIFRSGVAHYVVHVDAQQQTTPVAAPSRFDDYAGAHDRLQQEFHSYVHTGRGYMTRADHLAWAKARALDVLETGTIEDAFASLAADLQKHRELEQHVGIGLGMQMLGAGLITTREQMRRHIEGCR